MVESAAASKEIINKCLEEKPSVIFENVFRLFMKIYEAAIGNYLAQHMCIGGLVLVGSLTNGILPKISKMKLLEEWKKRHVEFASNIEDLPLVVCREVDLGLKGAFVVARRIIADNQHEWIMQLIHWFILLIDLDRFLEFDEVKKLYWIKNALVIGCWMGKSSPIWY